MRRGETEALETMGIAKTLSAARNERGLTQTELAERCQLKRQQINYFESGVRVPSLKQLFQISRALDLPLQRLLSGTNQPGSEVREMAIELRNMGLIDLWVESPIVPGAFRHPEEVLALAVAGEKPETRIVEGVPTILAWNQWNSSLLWAFAR